MRRLECEDFRLAIHIRPRRAVVDDVPNEELVVLPIDIRDEDSNRGSVQTLRRWIGSALRTGASPPPATGRSRNPGSAFWRE